MTARWGTDFGAHPTREQVDALPASRTTSVIAGTRLDLLAAVETVEATQPQMVELLLRDVYRLGDTEIAGPPDAPVGMVKIRVHDGRRLVRPPLRFHG